MSNFEPPIMTIKGAKLSFGTNHLFTDVELYITAATKSAWWGGTAAANRLC